MENSELRGKVWDLFISKKRSEYKNEFNINYGWEKKKVTKDKEEMFSIKIAAFFTLIIIPFFVGWCKLIEDFEVNILIFSLIWTLFTFSGFYAFYYNNIKQTTYRKIGKFNPKDFEAEFEREYPFLEVGYLISKIDETKEELFGKKSEFQVGYEKVQAKLGRCKAILSTLKDKYVLLTVKTPQDILLAINELEEIEISFRQELERLNSFRIGVEEVLGEERTRLLKTQNSELPRLRLLMEVQELTNSQEEITEEGIKIIENITRKVSERLVEIRRESRENILELNNSIVILAYDISEKFGPEKVDEVIWALVEEECEVS